MSQNKRSVVVDGTWAILEDPESCPAAKWYSRVVGFVLFVSLSTSLYVTMESDVSRSFEWSLFELCLDTAFICELICRFIVSKSRRTFFLNPFNLIDSLVLSTLTLRLLVGLPV